jgi:hypothetical protein
MVSTLYRSNIVHLMTNKIDVIRLSRQILRKQDESLYKNNSNRCSLLIWYSKGSENVFQNVDVYWVLKHILTSYSC